MNEEAKQKITSVFDTVSDQYDNPATRFFLFCGDRLVSHLQPRRGDKVLDIASGTGAVALPAAQAIAPTGRVQAIDLSNNMLEVAAKNIQRAGLDNVDFHTMDAESLDFKSQYFDGISCSFGIFFLGDMGAALKEWKRVLKPGARLMFTSFADAAFTPLAEQFRSDIEHYGVTVPEESWKRLGKKTQCEALLQQAGYENIQVISEQLGYHLNGVADWWEIIYNTGYRGFLEALDVKQLHDFRQQHLEAVQQWVTEKGLWLDVETLFASGQRPV